MVWLKDLDKDGGLIRGGWDHSERHKFVDLWRNENGMFPPVKHSDVYELVTVDPKERPLPCLRLLQTQYGIHKLLGAMETAGPLKTCFDDDPPDDGGGVPEDAAVPEEWAHLLDAAVRRGFLDHEKAEKWVRAFIKDAQEEA